MMFRGEDDIADAGELGQSGPIGRIEFARVEGFGKFFEEVLGVVVRSADQRVADDGAELAIDTPMNE